VARKAARSRGLGLGLYRAGGGRSRARPPRTGGGAGLPAWHAMAMAPGLDGLRRAWLPGRSGPGRAGLRFGPSWAEAKPGEVGSLSGLAKSLRGRWWTSDRWAGID
jgi:hypothetical protein